MYEPAEQVERRQGHEAATVPTKPVPSLIRRISTEFGLRHVRGVAITRLLVTVWLVILGSFFCLLGHWYWLGALLFVPAALNGWLAYQMPRWNGALDALKNGPRVRELERSRALVVDDAAARLRRIEQDLHDGAQAQMVAVVMKLGLAKERFGGRGRPVRRSTWSGLWSWSTPPTAEPRRPSPSYATWPAASTRRP